MSGYGVKSYSHVWGFGRWPYKFVNCMIERFGGETEGSGLMAGIVRRPPKKASDWLVKQAPKKNEKIGRVLFFLTCTLLPTATYNELGSLLLGIQRD